MNLGLIGLGRWGRNYIKTINSLKDSRLSVICSTRMESYGDLTERPRGQYRWTNNYKNLCESQEVDIVLVATNPSIHYEITKYALECGKHVICEKPFVFSTEEAAELFGLAVDQKKNLITNYVHLWQPRYKEIKARLQNKGAAKIHSLGFGNGPFRKDYSPLWDWVPHDLALCLDFTNNHAINGKITALNPKWDAKNNYDITINFHDGSEAHINSGNLAADRWRCFGVTIGEETMLFMDDFKSNPLKLMLEEFISNAEKGILTNDVNLTMAVTSMLNQLDNQL